MGLLDKLLDASVLLSFDRTGFRRHARRFVAADLQTKLTGKVVLVTGANSGLGLATARALAALDARVRMLCRDPARGAQAFDAVKAEHPAADVRLLPLDVSLLGDVERFAAAFDEPVDVLVNNAGVLPDTLRRTSEGHELTFATNVLGPFALTAALLPKLRAASGRVVTVSSGGMYTQRLELPLLEARVEPFDGVTAYAQTKRAEVVLNELWAAREPAVTFSVMHPGWADTPSVKTSLPRVHQVTRPLLRSSEEGADTVVWLTACARLSGISGQFWFDRAAAPTQVFPWTRESPADRAALWELCARAHPELTRSPLLKQLQ